MLMITMHINEEQTAYNSQSEWQWLGAKAKVEQNMTDWMENGRLGLDEKERPLFGG